MTTLEELVEKLRPIVPEVDRLYFASRVAEPPSDRLFKNRIISLAVRHLGYQPEQEILLPPPLLEEGEYQLGTVFYNEKEVGKFGLIEKEWIRHVGIYGSSGTGKTNCISQILLSLAEHKKPFLVFDWKKNYRDLLPLIPDLKIFTIGQNTAPFYFNPLKPPSGTTGDNYKSYLKDIISILASAYFPSTSLLTVQGVKFLLLQAADEICEEKRTYSGSEKYPTLADLLQHLKEKKQKRIGYSVEAVQACLYSLCHGPTGNVFNSQISFSPERLFDQQVVLELDSLGQQDRVFFSNCLLYHIYKHMETLGNREEFKLAVVLEEAHNNISSIMEICFRMIREFGVSLILVDQHPCKIPVTILGNTNTTILFGLKHSKDLQAASEAILLKEPDYLGKLPTGTAIVRLQDRYPQPFLVKFPQVPIEKGKVTDKEIANSMSRYLREIQPSSFKSSTLRQLQLNELPTEDEIKLLEDIKEHSDCILKERRQRIGWSERRFFKIRDRLVAKGLIDSKRLSTNKTLIVFLNLTEAGKEVLEEIIADRQTNK